MVRTKNGCCSRAQKKGPLENLKKRKRSPDDVIEKLSKKAKQLDAARIPKRRRRPKRAPVAKQLSNYGGTPKVFPFFGMSADVAKQCEGVGNDDDAIFACFMAATKIEQELQEKAEEETEKTGDIMITKVDIAQAQTEYGALRQAKKDGVALSSYYEKALCQMEAMKERTMDQDVGYADSIIKESLKDFSECAKATMGLVLKYFLAQGGKDNEQYFNEFGLTDDFIIAFLSYGRTRHQDARSTAKSREAAVANGKKIKQGLKVSTLRNWKCHISFAIKQMIIGKDSDWEHHPQWRNAALSERVNTWLSDELVAGLKSGRDKVKKAFPLTEEQAILMSKAFSVLEEDEEQGRCCFTTQLACAYRYQDLSLIRWAGLTHRLHPHTKDDMWSLLIEEPTKACQSQKMRWIQHSQVSYWLDAPTHLARWMYKSDTLVQQSYSRLCEKNEE